MARAPMVVELNEGDACVIIRNDESIELMTNEEMNDTGMCSGAATGASALDILAAREDELNELINRVIVD